MNKTCRLLNINAQTFISISVLSATLWGSAMGNSNENPSMLLRGYSSGGLVSREFALIMAEYLFKETYGVEDFKTQLPLNVTDSGDRWIIEGSRRAEDYPPIKPGQTASGKVKIVIMKKDCQVIDIIQEAKFIKK